MRRLVQGSVGSRGTVDPRALRDLAIVRYDALNEMTGQLSFSVALLNSAGDGVVLSSINSRSETRTYAKVVLGEPAPSRSPRRKSRPSGRRAWAPGCARRPGRKRRELGPGRDAPGSDVRMVTRR